MLRCKLYIVAIVLVLHFQELDLHNVVPEQPEHHVIEFSVTLVDYGYQEILRDADSPQFHDLSQHLQDQVCENDQTVIQNSVFLKIQRRFSRLRGLMRVRLRDQGTESRGGGSCSESEIPTSQSATVLCRAEN